MDIREKIKGTNTYSKLDKVQQAFILDKFNVKKIGLGVEMSRLRGFDYWERISHPSGMVRLTVKELSKNNEDV